MNSPVSSPDTPDQRRGVTLREGYDLYGARVRNRIIIGFALLGLAIWVWTLQARFSHGTTAHITLIWTAAALFGATEFSWSWARLLWRSWLKGKSFTVARLWYEMALAVLVVLFFGLYVLSRMRW
jgi:hypothetical protein